MDLLMVFYGMLGKMHGQEALAHVLDHVELILDLKQEEDGGQATTWYRKRLQLPDNREQVQEY